MNFKPNRFDMLLVGAALLFFLIQVSFLRVPAIWNKFLGNLYRLGVSTVALDGIILVTAAIPIGAFLFYCITILTPRLRRLKRLGLLAHLAALVLAWQSYHAVYTLSHWPVRPSHASNESRSTINRA